MRQKLLKNDSPEWKEISRSLLYVYALDARRVTNDADFAPYLEAMGRVRALVSTFPGMRCGAVGSVCWRLCGPLCLGMRLCLHACYYLVALLTLAYRSHE